MECGESSRREFDLADTWWGCSPDWLGAARGCAVKGEDRFRVCSDGADKESTCSCRGVALGKAVHRSNGDESVSWATQDPQF